jgi:hypothetical protein
MDDLLANHMPSAPQKQEVCLPWNTRHHWAGASAAARQRRGIFPLHSMVIHAIVGLYAHVERNRHQAVAAD